MNRDGTWRRQAVAGAVLLTCISVPVAQAVSSVPANARRAAEQRAAALSAELAPAPVDTSSWVTGTDPSSYDPLRTKVDLLVGYGADAPAIPEVTPRDETVIRESRSERIERVSADTHYDVPRAALTAYRRAAIVMAKTDSDCQVPWTLLAAIGQVESDQGRYAGSHVLADGSTSPHIVGLALTGAGATARIPDTDDGRLDGDTVWDRAVGPMQFIPSTWAVVGVDGDGNGTRDPHDFDDAALAAAVYLCAGDRDLSTTAGAQSAVYSYNHSFDYVSLVLAIAKRYEAGSFDGVPNDTDPGTPNPNPNPDPTPDPDPEPQGHPSGGPVKPHEPDPGPGPGPGPDPGPTPGPDPIPEPKPTVLTGVLADCDDDPADVVPATWCLTVDADHVIELDFGADADLTAAQRDYDRDGTVESVQDELVGLADQSVRVRLDDDDVVAAINDLGYESAAAADEDAEGEQGPAGQPAAAN